MLVLLASASLCVVVRCRALSKYGKHETKRSQIRNRKVRTCMRAPCLCLGHNVIAVPQNDMFTFSVNVLANLEPFMRAQHLCGEVC